MGFVDDMARKQCELKPLEETYAWPILGKSKELFLREAENAGMVEGEHYVIKSDGSVWSSDWDMEMMDDHICCSMYEEENTIINELVVLNDDNVPTTTSLKVAEVTGKRHADVIRKIESLECSISFTERNIALSAYKDGSGRSCKMYNLTRDGMSFLIHKMSGEKAAEFTEKFIGAFNMMEEELLSKAMDDFQIPQTYADALHLAAEKSFQLELQAPKVKAYDDFLNSEGLTNLTDGFKSIVSFRQACVIKKINIIFKTGPIQKTVCKAMRDSFYCKNVSQNAGLAKRSF
jgi:Rha family phage regulatory protein